MADPFDTDFQLLAEHSIDVICRVALDYTVLYASPSSQQILGWKPEELVGTVPAAIVHEDDLSALAVAERHSYDADVLNSPATVRMHRKDGSLVWIEINARLVRDADTDEPQEFVLVMRDVTERKALEDQLAQLARTDGLTGLANRRAFDEALDREWRRTLREGSQMSLLLLDIDHFKLFNDHYGHQVGDDCLRAVAATIRSRARSTDTPARYGGEEIAIILPSTGMEGAVAAAEKVRVAITHLGIPHGGNREGGLLVTASVGVATAQARESAGLRMPETLLLAADAALYKAKSGGRNRVESSSLRDVAPQHAAA